jgi:Fur family ferric uptake transcriptional regulator
MPMAAHDHSHPHASHRVDTNVRDRLRDAGLRVTASRIAVLELLQAHPEPMTHQEVVEAFGESPWNRSTLYRNLIDLTDAGLARKTVIAGLMRFEPTGRNNGCGDHAHFVCSDCGEVTHLDGVVVRLEGGAQPRAVRSGAIEVQLRGRCDRCDSAPA